jgi:hypothetical protein
VGGMGLGPRRAQPGDSLSDKIRADVGHPAQQHEAELPPRQSPHEPDPVTMRSC